MPDAPTPPNTTGPESLQAPRLAYLEAEEQREKSGGPPKPGSGSFLLDYWNTPALDRPNHVIVRVPDSVPHGVADHPPQAHADGERSLRSQSSRSPSPHWTGPGGLILLNRYPYSNGHLLIALSVARGRLVDYTPIERAAFWRLVDLAAELMERTLQPQGINLGVNQGRAAGAGVPQHLHAHLVPRWAGDVNYMSVIGGVRVNPAALEAMAERYRAVCQAMVSTG